MTFEFGPLVQETVANRGLPCRRVEGKIWSDVGNQTSRVCSIGTLYWWLAAPNDDEERERGLLSALLSGMSGMMRGPGVGGAGGGGDA